MFLLIFIIIAANHLAYPYVSTDKFSCIEPDKDAESFLQLMEAATLWNQTKMNFIAGFSNGRNKIRDRLEFAQYWPDDMNGIPNAQQNAERATQKKDNKSKGTWTTIFDNLNQIIYKQKPMSN